MRIYIFLFTYYLETIGYDFLVLYDDNNKIKLLRYYFCNIRLIMMHI